MQVEGIALCLGDNVDTDVIIAGRYLRTKDRGIWAAKAFEDLDPALAARLKGAFIVAGKNFGCGSSREQAAVALKEAGVAAVSARSFGRIFSEMRSISAFRLSSPITPAAPTGNRSSQNCDSDGSR